MYLFGTATEMAFIPEIYLQSIGGIEGVRMPRIKKGIFVLLYFLKEEPQCSHSSFRVDFGESSERTSFPSRIG